jgi:uncharacterized protein (DUF433 family)
MSLLLDPDYGNNSRCDSRQDHCAGAGTRPARWGQRITVEVRPLDEPPAWLDRFAVDPAARPGNFAIKGTHLLVDDLVQLVDDGRTDEELRQAHPELAAADVDAVRNNARVPESMRRSFGGWSEETLELDEYLAWTLQQRKVRRREIEE